MTPKLILTLLALFCILAGFLSLNGARKNKHINVNPRKASARLIRNVLGDTGTKYFLYISGSIFTLFGLGLIYVLHLRTPSLPTGYEKTEKIKMQIIIQGMDNKPAIATTLIDGIFKLNHYGEYQPEKYSEILKISFKNNYLSSLPDCMYKMHNLNEIDIRNNHIGKTELIETLNKLNKIDTLRFYGNGSVNSYDEIKRKFPDIYLDTSSSNLLQKIDWN